MKDRIQIVRLVSIPLGQGPTLWEASMKHGEETIRVSSGSLENLAREFVAELKRQGLQSINMTVEIPISSGHEVDNSILPLLGELLKAEAR